MRISFPRQVSALRMTEEIRNQRDPSHPKETLPSFKDLMKSIGLSITPESIYSHQPNHNTRVRKYPEVTHFGELSQHKLFLRGRSPSHSGPNATPPIPNIRLKCSSTIRSLGVSSITMMPAETFHTIFSTPKKENVIATTPPVVGISPPVQVAQRSVKLPCKYCNGRFSNKESLRVHTSRRHREQRDLDRKSVSSKVNVVEAIILS